MEYVSDTILLSRMQQSALLKPNISGSDTREDVRRIYSSDKGCHHASGTVQDKYADSVKSIEDMIGTRDSYCEK